MQPAASPARPSAPQWWWVLDPSRSLRARAALIATGVVLALSFILSWSTGLLYRRSLETQVANTFETLALQLSDKLDRAIYERYRSLQIAASLTSIRDVAGGLAERRNVLDALQESTPEFAWIGLTDATGRVIVGTRRIFEDVSMEMRPWFRNGREKPFIGPLHEVAELTRGTPATPEAERARMFLDIAVPVTGSDGQFAGVLAAHVRWTWTQEVQTSVIPEAAAREFLGVTVYGGHDVLLDSGGSGWSMPLDPPAVGDGRRFRGWMIESVPGGMRYLTGFARSRGFREYRGIGWLTVVRQPVDRVFASVPPLRRAIVGWGTAFALAAGAVSWVLAGRHARRLRSVRAAAERIKEGDILTVMPRAHDNSEVSAMCGALGELVEDLRAQQERVLAENARLATQLRENDAAKR